MQFIIGIVVLIFDIIAIMEILKSSFDQGKKVLWILLILFLPLVGLILYYLIAKKK